MKRKKNGHVENSRSKTEKMTMKNTEIKGGTLPQKSKAKRGK